MPNFRLKPLDLESIARFFAGVGAEHKCELCGSRSFGVHPSADNESSAFVISEFFDESARIRGQTPVLTMVCTNCGNMKFHDRETIDSWLEANPEIGASDE